MTDRTRKAALAAAILAAGGLAPAALSAATVLATSDGVIRLSLCVGTDCPSSPSFGSDTVRLQENNTRLHFDDTSNSASFPRNDWRLVANDSANGGASFFGVEDATAGRYLMYLEAAAPANSIYLDSTGNVGFGRSNPSVELHVADGDTPTLRLEQDGSSGFQAQTWDIAGNEASFFVRDVTNGSKLSFRIRPNAPESSIDIEGTTGDIGIGTGSPVADLHINRTGVTETQLRLSASGNNGSANADLNLSVDQAGQSVSIDIDDADAPEFTVSDSGSMTLTSTESFNLFRIEALGASPNTQADFTFTDAGAAGQLRINIVDGDGREMSLDDAGNVVISGTLTENSDRLRKTAIVPVDATDILRRVRALPLSTWTYKDDVEEGIRHIGPMAQDFHALFGTGASSTGISTLDTSGVALAAIQALSQENAALRERLEALEARTR